MAEDLALDQGGGDGGAVDGDEGLVPPRREVVDRAGDDLLAGPALAGDGDAGLGGRDLLDELEHLAHARRLADEVRGAQLLQPSLEGLDLAQRLLALEGVGQDDLQLSRLHRLLDVVVGARPDRRHRVLHASPTGEEDHRAVRHLLAQGLEQPESVGAGHGDVGDDDVGEELGGAAEGLGAIRGHLHLVSPGAEQLGQRFAGLTFIIHGQDS